MGHDELFNVKCMPQNARSDEKVLPVNLFCKNLYRTYEHINFHKNTLGTFHLYLEKLT